MIACKRKILKVKILHEKYKTKNFDHFVNCKYLTLQIDTEYSISKDINMELINQLQTYKTIQKNPLQNLDLDIVKNNLQSSFLNFYF